MDVLLQAILDGSLEWEVARSWILAESDDATSPLPDRGLDGTKAAITPSACRRYALGFIREQVAPLLSAGWRTIPRAVPVHAL